MSIVIGCDFHPSFQHIVILDKKTGEVSDRRLAHIAEAQGFYAALSRPVLVGMEACGYSQWFERLLAELGHELWIGDAGQIRAAMVRKQKTDKRDAEHLLKLLLEERFPRIWVPSPQERDLRQLIVHRHKRVQARTQVKNQLQALALNQGLRLRRKLWTRAGRQQLEQLELMPFADQRRRDLLRALDQLEADIAPLNEALGREAEARRAVQLLMTHPGVGPVVGLAFLLTLGPPQRFQRPCQVASYFGLIPREHSSGGRQQLGRISKQGNALMRFLLVEAAQTAIRGDLHLRRHYYRVLRKHNVGVAKVAVARKLAQRLYCMLRHQLDYEELAQRGSYAGKPESFRG